ncbi:MAG: gliding motility-associated C-terminal domain-containing protein [Lewinellaceae bacterium]|nr:gliding motility-associated C-terminal domain-containing protein [Lewinellaceae bacterium]
MLPDHKLSIFNRWGDVVYESRDYQGDWDGIYKGRELPYRYLFVCSGGGSLTSLLSFAKPLPSFGNRGLSCEPIHRYYASYLKTQCYYLA